MSRTPRLCSICDAAPPVVREHLLALCRPCALHVAASTGDTRAAPIETLADAEPGRRGATR